MAIGDHGFRGQWWRAITAADSGVKRERLTVAMVIAAHARRDGTCAVVSMRELADATGYSERSCRRYVASLRKAGWIDLARRGHRTGDGRALANVYALSLPATQGTGRGQPATQVADREPDDAEDEISTGHPGDRLTQVSTGQPEISTGQIGPETASQPATQVAAPSKYFPSEISPPRGSGVPVVELEDARERRATDCPDCGTVLDRTGECFMCSMNGRRTG